MAYSDKYLNSYDRTIADVEAGSDRNVVADYNPIQPVEAGQRDKVEQGIATTLGLFDDDERKNLRRARSLSTIGEVINPAYGVSMAAGDFEDARQEGDVPGMLLSGIGALPLVGPPLRAAGKSVANVINRTALGTQTNIPDFYSSAIKGKKNFLEAFGKSVPEAIQESVDPAKRASTRVLGIQNKKLDDVLGAKGEDAEFTAFAIASGQGKEMGGGAFKNTALFQGPIALNYLEKGFDVNDTARLVNAVGNGYRKEATVPDEIAERYAAHIPATHKTNGKPFEVLMKDPDGGGGGKGYIEGVGAGGSGAPVVRAFSTGMSDRYLEKTVNNMRKAKGLEPFDKLPPELAVELAQISTTIDNRAVHYFHEAGLVPQGEKRMVFELDAEGNKKVGPPRISKKTGKPLKPKVLPKVWAKDPVTGEGLYDYSPESANKVAELVLKARYAGHLGLPAGGEKIKLVGDTFDDLLYGTGKVEPKLKMAPVRDGDRQIVGGNQISDIKKPRGYFAVQQSFTSRQQELGGMNAFLAIDPYNEKMYTGLSDGHDIFGINPIGGHGVLTVQPLIAHSYRGQQKFVKDIQGRLTPDRLEAASKRVEAITGVPRTAEEADMADPYFKAKQMAYNKRAMNEYEPKVTQADIDAANSSITKLEAAKVIGKGTAVGATTAAGVGMLSAAEEEE